MKPSLVTWPELLQRKVYFCLTLIFYQENSGWAHWNKNIISYPAHHNDFSTVKHPAVHSLFFLSLFLWIKNTYIFFFFILTAIFDALLCSLVLIWVSHKDIGSLLMYQEREGVITDNTTQSKDKVKSLLKWRWWCGFLVKEIE